MYLCAIRLASRHHCGYITVRCTVFCGWLCGAVSSGLVTMQCIATATTMKGRGDSNPASRGTPTTRTKPKRKKPTILTIADKQARVQYLLKKKCSTSKYRLQSGLLQEAGEYFHISPKRVSEIWNNARTNHQLTGQFTYCDKTSIKKDSTVLEFFQRLIALPACYKQTYQSIADALDLTPSAVYNRIRHACTKLNSEIDKDDVASTAETDILRAAIASVPFAIKWNAAKPTSA